MTTRPMATTLDDSPPPVDAPAPHLCRPRPTWRDRFIAAGAIAFGVTLTLAMQGYQFGQSNHTVYLIDALRQTSPTLLANDWFATQTLHYHAAFGLLTRGLMGLRIVEPAFFIGHVLLAAALHTAWWRIVRTLGGDARTFLVSEVLFHLAAGGTGLGMYQFLQDGAFLPSNIAAVAMLWGLCLWLENRRVVAGACFGVAGLFHLNFALVGVFVWALLNVCELRATQACSTRRRGRAFWIAAALAVAPSLINIAFAMRTMRTGRGAAMPFAEFVDLYVRLRHPHHYDPSTWPPALWLSFFLPLPLALAAWRRSRLRAEITPARVEFFKIFLIFSLLLLVALIGAGLTYTSEPLIQASLYRFSIYVKFLSCIAAGLLITRVRYATAAAIALGVIMLALCLARGPFMGFFRIPADDPAYLAACDWIRSNTPADAVFLVPPDEQAFRVRARRAIVVNFKGVPQLSPELRQWRERLQDVLDLPDLRALPRGRFDATLTAIRQRYQSLPPAHLQAVSRKYGVRYVLVAHEIPVWADRRVDFGSNTKYFLYDLSR